MYCVRMCSFIRILKLQFKESLQYTLIKYVVIEKYVHLMHFNFSPNKSSTVLTMTLCFGHPLAAQEQTQLARSMALDTKRLQHLHFKDKLIPIHKTLIIKDVASHDQGTNNDL